MESKADVKAIMARFQATEVTSEASSTLPGRAKPPLQPTLSSSPAVPAKKPVLGSLSGSTIKIPPKPTVKNTDAQEPNKSKPLVSKFSNAPSSSGDKPEDLHKTPQKPFVPQPPEAKAPAVKPSASKPLLSTTQSDSKPAISKPSPPVLNRPSRVKEDTGGGETGSTPPKLPPAQQKPPSSISKLRQQTETPTPSKPSLPSAALKPPSNFKEAQSIFNKEAGGPEQPEGVSKAPPTATNATPPPKPAASKKPSLKKPPPQVSSFNGDAANTGPKRKPLVSVFALGPAPAKPNRPPTVNLEPFRRGAERSIDGPDTFNKPIAAPLTSYPGNHSNHSTPSQPPPPPALPSLPPRHPGTMIQQEDFYDDIDEVSSTPPPLPPAAGHPSQRAKAKGKSDDQDDPKAPDKQRQAADQKLNKDKKLLEAEKKEQEARKKFKLSGPLETIHQVKARLDYRGSKTDLPLKQGEDLDVIRVQGNPEGKWLGRNLEGSIGYVKIASVEIDFNSLKRCKVQQLQEQEVYDDVAPDISAIKGRGVVLPPLPGEEGELYDDVMDPNLEVRVPPPSQFTSNGNSADQPAAAAAAIDEDVYDDVDSQALPPPPQHSSLPGLKFISKAAEMVPKKQKKMEKEEKEFRKKFKYEGEIQVLYQVTIIPTLTNKKWASKELAVKAGERVDVIAKAEDDRLICRSEEGKFGYVSTSNIIMNDCEIYDDIGDDCIYDND